VADNEHPDHLQMSFDTRIVEWGSILIILCVHVCPSLDQPVNNLRLVQWRGVFGVLRVGIGSFSKEEFDTGRRAQISGCMEWCGAVLVVEMNGEVALL